MYRFNRFRKKNSVLVVQSLMVFQIHLKESSYVAIRDYNAIKASLLSHSVSPPDHPSPSTHTSLLQALSYPHYSAHSRFAAYAQADLRYRRSKSVHAVGYTHRV